MRGCCITTTSALALRSARRLALRLPRVLLLSSRVGCRARARVQAVFLPLVDRTSALTCDEISSLARTSERELLTALKYLLPKDTRITQKHHASEVLSARAFSELVQEGPVDVNHQSIEKTYPHFTHRRAPTRVGTRHTYARFVELL